MPVSAEQWRASVGCNNPAHWHGRDKGNEIQDFEAQLMTYITFILDFHRDLKNFQALLITSCGNSPTHGHTHKRVIRGLLCLAFLITVTTYLLLCSGDVETNPGPITLTTNDLAKIRHLTFDACDKWYSFGLELGLSPTTLHIVQQNFQTVEDRFTDMLERWLRMTNPLPTWERLAEALSVRIIGLPDVAEQVKEEYKKLKNSAADGSKDEIKENKTEQACPKPPERCDVPASNNENKTEQACPKPPERCDVSASNNESRVQPKQQDNVAVDPKIGAIKKQINQLDAHFYKIMRKTYKKVKEEGMDVDDLRLCLDSLLPEHKGSGEHTGFFEMMDEQFDQCSTLAKLWSKLSRYWDYLNYTLLESLIHRLDDESLVQEMDHYLSSLRSFQASTRLCDFAKCLASKKPEVRENLEKFVAKLDLDWEACTLTKLDKLQGNIICKFNLPNFSMILEEVTSGIVIVTWALPKVLALRVKSDIENTNMSSFYMELGIKSIHIQGEECKYSALKHYAAHLKNMYSQLTIKNLAPFKLAAIGKKVVGRSEFDKYTKSTLRGDTDDVVYRKHHMDEHEVCCSTRWTNRKQPRLVLIEGAPGVGKTTFSQQFCYKWSQGQRLSEHKLLVLLPLRDEGVRSAKNVSDLFPHSQLQQAIAEEVEESDGEGVALWLEAWDELEENKRENVSLFLQLVHGRVLPKSTVIITSRPWATENIRKSANVEVDQHIEVVSTSSIQLRRVLKERVRPDSSAKFLDYLDDRPVIKAAMHTPVTANIVADVFQWCRDTESPLPTTMTELYTALTCKLLMEHLSSHKAETSKSQKIRSLDEVPKDTKKQLLNLCGLSWQGLVKQQLTFSSDDVGGDTLGLMHAVKELYGGKDDQLSYHFIHLTLQEFLSAYHITQLPPDGQEQIIREHIDTGHLAMTVRFFFGLTKPNTLTSSLMSHHISSQRHSRNSNVFHWLFENGEGKPVGSEWSVSVWSSYSWSPLDYYVLGHAISQCNFSCELYLRNTSMGDEGMEMLCKGMSASTDNTCAGKITKADFSRNNITSEGVKWLHNIQLVIIQQLEHLNLGTNEIDRSGLIAFSQVIPKLTMLQDLSLDRNPISEGGAVEVLRSLHHYKTPLKTLDLQHTGIGEQDGVPLVQLGDNVLETLKISGDLLPSIMKCPLPNSTLQTLSIYPPLSEEATMSLSSLLQQSMLNFSKLDITWCDVTSDGAVQLARALTDNSWLTELDMEGNSIGEEGAQALANMLKENRTLKKLDLCDDWTLGEGVDVLISSLQENKTLEGLELSDQYQRPSDPRVEWRKNLFS